MRQRLIGLCFCLLLGSQSLADNLPANLADLWNISSDPVPAQTSRVYKIGLIKVEEIHYRGRPYKNKPVTIFGYYCYPFTYNKKIPAILLVHGGGGGASLVRSLKWAKRGYAVLAIDLPGKGDQRTSSRSTGPNMDVSELLRVKPDLADNYLVHAVAATRNGITYLTQRKEVDPSRIGMVGLSWGGVITILTNGQDNRLKTTVNVFGAGFIPAGCTWQDWFDSMTSEETTRWNDYIDPKNFLATQHAPLLFLTGTNDHCYYLPTFQKSYQQIKTPKTFVLIPNLRHQFWAAEETIVVSWMNNTLKGNGNFPVISTYPLSEKENYHLILPTAIQASGEAKVKSAVLYYAAGSPSYWTKKIWKGLPAYYENNIYYFAIPTMLISPEIIFYVSAEDTKGGMTSTLARSILKINLPNNGSAYAVSGPIEQTYMHKKPLEVIGHKIASGEVNKVVYQKKVFKIPSPQL